MGFVNKYGILFLIIILVVAAGFFIQKEMQKDASPSVGAPGAPPIAPGNTGIGGGLIQHPVTGEVLSIN